MPLTLLAAAGALLAAAGALLAHVRLQNPANDAPLFWQNPESIWLVLGSIGSDDLSDGSHLPALRNAVDAWNGVGETEAHLWENADPAQQARADWWADDIHLVMFDENNGSGYFPAGSGIVALTPIWFQGSGKITDADVLFNGKTYAFTTSGTPGRFDVQDVAAHELGHLLGLDHTGSAGGTLYPYVDTAVILHRSVSADEVAGLRAAYPDPGASAPGRIQGLVQRASNNSPVAGALVVALDAAGRGASSILSQPNGSFALESLAAGSYTVYARPLDSPVSASNLGAGWTVHTDFEPAWFPLPIAVTAGGTAAAGTLLVGADVALNLGRSSDDLPLRATSGKSTVMALTGTGLVNGSSLVSSDPDVAVTPISWLGSAVLFSTAVPAGEPPGNADLIAIDPAGRKSVLSGGLEVVPPSPTVTSSAPAVGSDLGGTALSIHGTGFLPGLRVVIGGSIYREGEPGGAILVDPTEIQLETDATAVGLHDVVVIDASGVEGRLADGYQVASLPEILAVFPVAGQHTGGTEVLLHGENFAPGLVVRIDGQVQGAVVVEGPESARVTTEPGLPGGPYLLELENPDGYLASAAFAYTADPDPVLAQVTPASGSAGGGESVTLLGANFTPGMQVIFGADPLTGAGGVASATVVWISADTLTAVTPAMGSGAKSVLVGSPSGQGSLLPAAFSASSSGSGGGACSTARGGGGAGPRDALAALWWLAALLVWTAWRACRAPGELAGAAVSPRSRARA